MNATNTAHVVSDWELVVWCLSPTKDKLGHLITTVQAEAARRLADGFGTVVGSTEPELVFLWDWSHVRDSSPTAVAAMAAYLRGVL